MADSRSLSQLSGKRSLDSEQTAVSQASLHSSDTSQLHSSDTSHFPDLLDIPNRDQQVSPTCTMPLVSDTRASTPPQLQHLNASNLLPSSSGENGGDGEILTCTCPDRAPQGPPSYCSIATAAILPPPPSFLCPDVGQVKTIALNKHSSFSPPPPPLSSRMSSSTTPSSSFLTLPRGSSRNGTVKLVPCYDGAGPRTSIDGYTNNRPSEDDIPLPPPAMFSEQQTNKFPNCVECESDQIKSLLKTTTKKGSKKLKVIENPEGGEVWKSNYCTLPNSRNRCFSSTTSQKGMTSRCSDDQPGSQV